MIQESIEIHDKYQFEIKIGYKISPEDLNTLYNIEMYFFIPNSLDINKNSYTKKDFYGDLQTYLRFKSPTVILRNIASPSKDSPIQKLKNSFEQLLKHQDDNTTADYVRQLKMFACILKSALRDHVSFIAKQKIKEDTENLINEYIRVIPNIVSKYRELRSIINVPSISEKLYSYYLFGDEYLSFIIEESTYNLINYLKSNHDIDFAVYSPKIYEIIQNEMKNRITNKYPSVPTEKGDNEEIIFRKSVLKKFTASALYLKTTKEKEGIIIEQLLFGVAAGLSMLFATAVAFYSQLKYGSISSTVFIILIISYMFKDRIKELLRAYFSKKMQYFLFDHTVNLFTAEKEKIGWLKESFYFTKEENVDKEIMRIRNRDHITEIENGWMGEKIAVYIEKVNLSSKKLIDLYKDYTVEGVNNVMRFDVLKFLSKMDDPEKSLFVLNENGPKEITGKRVYHLNLVIKYHSKSSTTYKRFRIVLNRDGIRRIEEVASLEEPI